VALAHSGPRDVVDVRFLELGEVNLKGFAKPVKVFEAHRT